VPHRPTRCVFVLKGGLLPFFRDATVVFIYLSSLFVIWYYMTEISTHNARSSHALGISEDACPSFVYTRAPHRSQQLRACNTSSQITFFPISFPVSLFDWAIKGGNANCLQSWCLSFHIWHRYSVLFYYLISNYILLYRNRILVSTLLFLDLIKVKFCVLKNCATQSWLWPPEKRVLCKSPPQNSTNLPNFYNCFIAGLSKWSCKTWIPKRSLTWIAV
jgi:hypothetical protein